MKTGVRQHGWRVVYVLALSVCAGILYWGTVTLVHMPEYVRGIWGGEEGTILFVGDVMLSRQVETYMKEGGGDYPFRKITELLHSYDHVVGNLEGSIPEVHIPTPIFTFRFSIDIAAVPELIRAGFTLVTLANNHAFDFGEEGYMHTTRTLEEHGLMHAGHPGRVREEDVEMLSVGTAKVAIIPVHAVPNLADATEVMRVIEAVSQESDIQIISIHWGEEYDLTGNASERALGERFIDAGADAVVGHHPHVVQNIEVYRGAPIFYSLGNFVFDQYWDRDVQEGLAIGLTISQRSLTYELIPIESTRSVPRVMGDDARRAFLRELAKHSDPTLASHIEKGLFEFKAPALATSEMAAMMGTY